MRVGTLPRPAGAAIEEALRDHFSGLSLIVEASTTRHWTSATFDGGRHELTIKLEGRGAGCRADAFVERYHEVDLRLSGHILISLAPGAAVRACRGSWARLAITAETVVDHPSPPTRTFIADPDLPPAGIVVAVEREDPQPFFLLGFPCGAIVVTNAAPAPAALRLYRFRDERQARAAGEVIEQHARLDVDGQTWFVPDARGAGSSGLRAARAALVLWTERVDGEIARRVRGLGPGFYSLTHKARGYL